MYRNYEYRDYVVNIVVEVLLRVQDRIAREPSFTAVVQVTSKRASAPLTAPLRLEGRTGEAFHTEADAVMGGYTAGQVLIDRLLRAEQPRA